MGLPEHLRLENLAFSWHATVQGKNCESEGRRGKWQKTKREEEEDSIGRGISERWFNEAI